MRTNMRYSSAVNYEAETPMTASGLRASVVLACALLVGATAQAQQPAQKAAATAAKAEPVTTAAAQKPADPSPVLLRDAQNAGFRLEHVRGVVMFCRTAKELGSNFAVRTCYDEQQTKIKIQEYQAQRNQLGEMHSNGTSGN